MALECAVCLEVKDSYDKLPCGHSFCDDCLHQWTEKGNKSCPCCREVYGEHSTYKLRLATFKDWEWHHIVKPEDMAATGLVFYSRAKLLSIPELRQVAYMPDVTMVTICHHCNTVLHSWEAGDVPAEEHRKHSATLGLKCPFVSQ